MGNYLRTEMKMKVRHLILLPSILLAGCASPLMSPVEPASPSPDQAVITFYRDAMMGGAIQAPIAEESGDGVALVGISSKDTKIQQVVAPGTHRYVVGGEDCHMIEASVEAGRSYYVEVDPRMGWVKARFHLVVRKDGEASEAVKDAAGLGCIAPNAKGRTWFEGHHKSMLDKLREARSEHDYADAESNMTPADGIPFAEDTNLRTVR